MISRRQFVGAALALGGAYAIGARISQAKPSEGFLVLKAEEFDYSLAPQELPNSPFWFYNRQTPGPEIRVRKGETVKVRFINQLPEPTSIHWHGIRIDNAMDGVSGLTQQAVAPGESFDYEFVAPDAGTYWYHAHNKSWNEVARGLYGALIVDELEPTFERANEITLVVDDWRVDREGNLDLASLGALMDWSHGGRLGNILTVNGQFQPKFEVKPGQNYRLRLINASNARILHFDPARIGALVLAYDGQALSVPATSGDAPLFLGPAQRADLLVTPSLGQDFELEEVSTDRAFPIVQFAVVGEATSNSAAPRLMPNRLPEPNLRTARQFRLDMTGGAMGNFVETTYNGKVLRDDDFRTTGQVWAFNGIANLAKNPFFAVERGESVTVDIINNTAFAHAMHVHGHHFKIVERVDSDIDEGQPWRDTFLSVPGETTRIAFVADNPGKWLLHCHMLEHAAAGMNTWFEVT